jgi:hypothetical protein
MVSSQDNQSLGTITISKKYEEVNWTNVTLTGNEFSISSDDPFYDNLSGELFQNYWNIISPQLDAADFWNFEGNDASDLFLSASVDGDTHVVGMDVSFLIPSPILDLQYEILRKYDILTGLHNHYSQWPIDVEIAVMESYPPQYGISAKVIRGNDLLTVVNEFDLTLAAGISSEGDLSWLDQSFELQETTQNIASGGQMIEVEFSTFSMGGIDDNLNYSNAVFLVAIPDLNNSIFTNNQFDQRFMKLNDAPNIMISSKLSSTDPLIDYSAGYLIFLTIPVLIKHFRKIRD